MDYYYEDAESDAPKVFALMMIVAGSAIEIGSALDVCIAHKEDLPADTSDCLNITKTYFGLGIGLFSLCLSLGLLLATTKSGPLSRNVETSFAGLLSIGWALGTAFNTSNGGPFTTSNNGYFATWICLIGSSYYLYLAVQQLKTVLDQEITKQNSGLALTFIASLFELSVAAEHCVKLDNGICSSKDALAVSIGALSFVLCLTQMMFIRLGAPAGVVCGKPIALTLLLLWGVGAVLNTSFNGPFDTPASHANGYFSTWIAFFSSVHFTYSMVLGPAFPVYEFAEGQAESGGLVSSQPNPNYSNAGYQSGTLSGGGGGGGGGGGSQGGVPQRQVVPDAVNLY